MLTESDSAEHMTMYHQDKVFTTPRRASCTLGKSGNRKLPVQIDEPLDESPSMWKLQSLLPMRQRALSYPSDNPCQSLLLLELPHHPQESSKFDISGESSAKESSMV